MSREKIFETELQITVTDEMAEKIGTAVRQQKNVVFVFQADYEHKLCTIQKMEIYKEETPSPLVAKEDRTPELNYELKVLMGNFFAKIRDAQKDFLQHLQELLGVL